MSRIVSARADPAGGTQPLHCSHMAIRVFLVMNMKIQGASIVWERKMQKKGAISERRDTLLEGWSLWAHVCGDGLKRGAAKHPVVCVELVGQDLQRQSSTFFYSSVQICRVKIADCTSEDGCSIPCNSCWQKFTDLIQRLRYCLQTTANRVCSNLPLLSLAKSHYISNPICWEGQAVFERGFRARMLWYSLLVRHCHLCHQTPCLHLDHGERGDQSWSQFSVSLYVKYWQLNGQSDRPASTLGLSKELRTHKRFFEMSLSIDLRALDHQAKNVGGNYGFSTPLYLFLKSLSCITVS